MIYLASDHSGFPLKEGVKEYLMLRGYKVKDVGPDSAEEKPGYPDLASQVAKGVAGEINSRGILISGTGQGMCIAANKFKNVSAALVFKEDLAEKTRLEDNSNVLCIPAEYVGLELAKKIVSIWLSSSFSGVDYCIESIKKIRKFEETK